MKSIRMFGLGFAVGAALFGALTAMAAGVFSAHSSFAVPLTVQVPDQAGAAATYAYTLTVDVTLDVDSEEVVSGELTAAPEAGGAHPITITAGQAEWMATPFVAESGGTIALVPTPTPIVTPTAEPSTASVSTVFTATVKSEANLRAGPGTNYGVIGNAAAGDVLRLEVQSEDGEWAQTPAGKWIAVFLLEALPEGLRSDSGEGSLKMASGLGVSLSTAQAEFRKLGYYFTEGERSESGYRQSVGKLAGEIAIVMLYHDGIEVMAALIGVADDPYDFNYSTRTGQLLGTLVGLFASDSVATIDWLGQQYDIFIEANNHTASKVIGKQLILFDYKADMRTQYIAIFSVR